MRLNDIPVKINAVPQIFHIRKLLEITAFYTVVFFLYV